MKNIILIGFMGTGKSTVGRRLAARLRREFVDTDREIERTAGRSIPEIFAVEGEEGFRARESRVVQEVATRENLVVATGGGVVLNPDNVRALRQNGVLIGLAAAPEVIYKRVGHKMNRPLLSGSSDLLQRIKELLAERSEAYRVAEFTVDTARHGVDETVELILTHLKQHGTL